MTILNLLIFLVTTAMLLLVLGLVRKRHLREKYSILWIVVFFSLAIFAFSGKIVDKIAEILGVGYAPSLLFLAGFFLLILLVLMLSVIDSHQTDKIVKLTQAVGLLEKRVKELEARKKR